MKLAQLFSDFEEELIRQGEEAESLSFVYRSLKKLSFTDFAFALQKEVTEEEKKFVEEIYKKTEFLEFSKVKFFALTLIVRFRHGISPIKVVFKSVFYIKFVNLASDFPNINLHPKVNLPKIGLFLHKV